MLHIYCGDGKGKTTAAIGLTVRMAGYGKKVLFMQFLKGSYTGEIEILNANENITVLRCDRNYGFSPSFTDSDRVDITDCHNKNLHHALENMASYDMIVLDEIIAACNLQLADIETVKRIVNEYTGELVLTGREPDRWLCERADYISEIKKIKHPFESGVPAREGIEY